MSGNINSNIQLALGLSAKQIDRLSVRSPYSYKVYSIPKRTGGTRLIAQPARETKIVQYWLIENVFSKLPVHECATAYEVGSSIKDNASRHLAGNYLSKFDFKNFFPSITSKDIQSHLRAHLSETLTEAEIAWISRISSFKYVENNNLCLSVGAPSSPLLSNSIMFDFDSEVYNWCNEHCVVYSRYADDITFSSSTKNLASAFEKLILDVAKSISYPRLKINENKTVHVSKKHQRRITGLIVNNDGKLSLGRGKKREISSMVHRFLINTIDLIEVHRLQGLLGFAINIEPDFITRLSVKYGHDLIGKILRMRTSIE